MSFRRLIALLFTPARPIRRPRPYFPLLCEPLEAREVPTANLSPIGDFDMAAGKDLLVPVSLSAPSGSAVTYSVSTDNPAVGAALVTGGRSWRLNVSGTDSNGAPFSGELTIRLFEDLAPVTTERIVRLTTEGFYNGLTFHRVIDGFVAQGGDPNGDGTGGSTLPDIPDEFQRSLTFTSPGLAAMANSGDDTNNSQFFITDTDLSLDQMPQHLNFNHTIFGILTSGFDTFQKIMTTPVGGAGGSTPTDPVRITSAEIFTDDQRGVVRISAPAGFTGTATVTVTADDGTGASAPETFAVRVAPDTLNDRPFLGPVQNVTTQVGTGVTLSPGATDLEGDPLTFVARDPNNFASPPPNVSVTIDQATGRVTLTPNPGFTGTVDVLLGVRDDTNRGGLPDDRSQFDTQRITLTVAGDIDLDPGSDSGPLDDDNITGVADPGLTVRAEPGRTVTLRVNGGAELAATEAEPGIYRVRLPAGALRVGTNTVTGRVSGGTGADRDLTPLTLTYAPRLENLFVVPGEAGVPRALVFDFVHSESEYANEVGVYVVDGFDGSVGGVLPGDPGYAAAVLNSAGRQVLFSPSEAPGASRTLTFNGGELLAFYLIQNSTSDDFLARNAGNAADGPVLAYFSFPAASPDGVNHLLATDDPLNSRALYAWEDLPNGGDRDYNDLVVSVRPEGAAAGNGDLTQILGASGRAVPVSFELHEAAKASGGPTSSTTSGEVGLFAVDGPDGAIGGLRPGDPGYLLAALDPSRRQAIFAPGASVPSTTSLTLPGGQIFGVYFIPGGTAEQWRGGNPGNDPGAGPVAFVSTDAANPDGVEHVRTFSPELVTRDEPQPGGPLRFHLMGTFGGTSADFDDVVFSMRVG